MSQAHRPTWNPKVGRETKSGSQQVSKKSLAAHTKLKFRQPGQTSTNDVAIRDLRAELLAAERAAVDKKRKAAGLGPLPVNSSSLRITGDGEGVNGEGEGEGEGAKRRKLLEEVGDLDKDDEDEEEVVAGGAVKGKGKAAAVDDDDDESDDDSDSDDDDDTAALMAELAKIKQERAEEKAKLDAETSALNATTREAEIATGNPLLNLASALGASTPGTPSSTNGSTASSTFAVKRRWDDDLIFKNQSAGVDDKPKKGEFVNDLLRSEFHKKFMLKFIK